MNDPRPDDPLTRLPETLRRDGFAFTPGAELRPALAARGLSDWAGFAASWNDLGLDTYMADGGRYRRRRFAVFGKNAAGLRRKPHQPHYQSRDYNPLNGGIERWFEPITEEVAAHPVMQAVLDGALDVFEQLSEIRDWHIELHQFRVEARTGEPGQPSPEGMHRDGVDYVLVVLVDRVNVGSGETSILNGDRRKLGSFTLTDALDSAWVDDWRVFHGVTPVTPIDPAQPAHRDVLVATFRRAGP